MEIINIVKNFVNRLVRLVKYIPVIWNSHDWDYGYTLDLLQYQLKRQADYIEKHGIHLNADNDISRIRTAINLIEIAYGDHYFDEYLERKVTYEEMTEKQEKAKRIVWRFIEHNIETWWD